MDINFLPGQKKREERKKPYKSGRKEIIWSEPTDSYKFEDSPKKSTSEDRLFSFFSKFKPKEKQREPKNDLKNKQLQKKKIKKSRKEILKSIKQEKKLKSKGKKISPLIINSLFKKQPKTDKTSTETDINYMEALNRQTEELKTIKVKKSASKKLILEEPTEVTKKETERKTPKTLVKAEKIQKKEKPFWLASLFKKKVKPKKTDDNYKIEKDKQTEELNPDESRSPDREKPVVKEKIEPKKEEPKKEALKEPDKADKDSWKSPEILETNLIKNEIVVFFNWQNYIIKLFVVIIISCSVMLGAYWSIIFWGNKKEAETKILDDKFKAISLEVHEATDEVAEVLQFNKRLKLVKSLLDQHIYWSNFFNFLEANTINSIFYSGFTGNLEGEYLLPATANTFKEIEAQVNSFNENDYVLEASANRGSTDLKDIKFEDIKEEEKSSVVLFDIKLIIDQSIFTD